MMAVIIDSESLNTREYGLERLGDVLDHIRASGRMVVQILVDGERPDLNQLATIRRELVTGHTVFLETAQPSEMAREALASLDGSLEDLNDLRLKAISHFEANQSHLAIQSLAAFFTTWHTAQLCVNKVAELAGTPIDAIPAGDQTVGQIVEGFTTILRELRNALKNRDYVMLNDMLRYDLEDAADKWIRVTRAMSQLAWTRAA